MHMNNRDLFLRITAAQTPPYSLYNNRLLIIKPKMHPVLSLSAFSFFYYIQNSISISISQPVYLFNNATAVLRDILACANKLVNRLPKSPSLSNAESSDATALISIGAERDPLFRT